MCAYTGIKHTLETKERKKETKCTILITKNKTIPLGKRKRKCFRKKEKERRKEKRKKKQKKEIEERKKKEGDRETEIIKMTKKKIEG